MSEDKMLSLVEAAEYLKVSETVVKEMIKSKSIKKSGVGKNIKVSKKTIDEWLSTLSENEEELLAMKRVICHFKDYFKPCNVFLDLNISDNKYEAIRVMSKKARDLKIVKDDKWLYEVVSAREDLVSTAVGKGVALLHARHMHPTKINEPTVLFGRSMDDIEFDAPDGQPVRLLFMLLLHNDKQHLFSLSYITKFLMQGHNIEFLMSANTPEEVYNAIMGNDND